MRFADKDTLEKLKDIAVNVFVIHKYLKVIHPEALSVKVTLYIFENPNAKNSFLS